MLVTSHCQVLMSSSCTNLNSINFHYKHSAALLPISGRHFGQLIIASKETGMGIKRGRWIMTLVQYFSILKSNRFSCRCPQYTIFYIYFSNIFYIFPILIYDSKSHVVKGFGAIWRLPVSSRLSGGFPRLPVHASFSKE